MSGYAFRRASAYRADIWHGDRVQLSEGQSGFWSDPYPRGTPTQGGFFQKWHFPGNDGSHGPQILCEGAAGPE